MSLSKSFNTNENAEKNGVWIRYSPNEDKTHPSFLIARSGGANKKYQSMLEAAIKPYRRQIQMETMDEELSKEIFKEVFCDSVLLDWENVPTEDVKGEGEGYAEFSKANAIELFDRLPELYEDLNTQAAKASTFLQANLEEDLKN